MLEAFPYLGNTISCNDQLLVGGVSEPEEGTKAVGNYCEGSGKDGSNGVGPGNYV